MVVTMILTKKSCRMLQLWISQLRISASITISRAYLYQHILSQICTYIMCIILSTWRNSGTFHHAYPTSLENTYQQSVLVAWHILWKILSKMKMLLVKYMHHSCLLELSHTWSQEIWHNFSTKYTILKTCTNPLL